MNILAEIIFWAAIIICFVLVLMLNSCALNLPDSMWPVSMALGDGYVTPDHECSLEGCY